MSGPESPDSIALGRALEALAHGSEKNVSLPPGTRVLSAPIVLDRPGINLRGATAQGTRLTCLKRGRLTNGELYKGPLLQILGAANIEINDLIVEGSRFEDTRDGRLDHRHPLDADRCSLLFLAARRLGSPACFEPSARVSDFEADVQIVGAEKVSLSNLSLRNAVRVGVAIGPSCHSVALTALEVGGAGDYGIWMGGALPNNPRLPLDAASAKKLPANITIADCLIERCGASGIYVDARNVFIKRSDLLQNHWDAPYDDEGGQLAIDYKAETVEVSNSRILAGGMLLRGLPEAAGHADRVLGCVGVEASGKGLVFRDVLIEGNSREGIQLMGAREVRVCGPRTRIVNNHLAEIVHPELSQQGQRRNISVTTTAELFQLNAVAAGLRLSDVRCENGVVVWSHPSKLGLAFDRLVVERCDLSGPSAHGIGLGDDPGGNLRGSGWSLGAWDADSNGTATR